MTLSLLGDHELTLASRLFHPDSGSCQEGGPLRQVVSAAVWRFTILLEHFLWRITDRCPTP